MTNDQYELIMEKVTAEMAHEAKHGRPKCIKCGRWPQMMDLDVCESCYIHWKSKIRKRRIICYT